MKQVNQKNSQEFDVQELNSSSVLSSLNMSVYNELNDDHQTQINVLELIQQQFDQIHDFNNKRSFLLKEISQYILK